MARKRKCTQWRGSGEGGTGSSTLTDKGEIEESSYLKGVPKKRSKRLRKERSHHGGSRRPNSSATQKTRIKE